MLEYSKTTNTTALKSELGIDRLEINNQAKAEVTMQLTEHAEEEVASHG